MPSLTQDQIRAILAEQFPALLVIGASLLGDLKTAVAPYLDGSIPVPPSGSPAGASILVTSHTDLKGEHLFVSADGAEMTGVIDWSDAALCDPMVDLQDLLIWLGARFLRLVLDDYGGAVDKGMLLERAVTYRRYECLRAIGVRLLGQSDDPLPLLITQLRWACTVE